MILLRLVKRIFLLLFVIFLASFGVSNKELLFVNLWPFNIKLQVPIYLFFYIAVIIGILLTSIYYLFKRKK